MGWLQFSMHKPVKEWFKKECLGENSEALDIAIVKRNTLYAAIKNKITGQVFCVVFLLRWSRDYHYNFAYKAMDEFCGPCEVECPERIFKLLTPLTVGNDENGWARKWRKSVAQYHASKNIIKGSFIFKTEEPIKFSNGGSYQYFEKEGRKIFVGRLTNDNEFVRYRQVKFNGLAGHKIEKLKIGVVV
jgi:hypothetical protein